MYGTIARMHVKPGMAEEFIQWNMENTTGIEQPGAMLAYRMDADPDVLYVVIASESREVYRAVAQDPATHERYLKMIEFLVEEPEWYDGEVIASEFNL